MKERQAGHVVFGRYQLVRPLARGGMSSVWVALDRKLKREVALKLMSPSYASSESSRQRFELEAMSVARLHSPHIVQVFDYGVDHHSPFIVMELLSGEDLRRRLKQEKRLSLPAMSRILGQAALGLGEAHDAGMIHRDMKPGNIFLTRTRSGEILKILDFGVAKAAGAEAIQESEITQRGSMVGTPQYMSPEQIRCLPDITEKSDLFSLGVIVYRGLTGQLPFKGTTTSDLAVNICSTDFEPPSQLVPDLPPGVDDFMRIALAKAPSDRFPTAAAMAEAFMLILPEGHDSERSLDSLSLGGPISMAPTSGRSASEPPSQASQSGATTSPDILTSSQSGTLTSPSLMTLSGPGTFGGTHSETFSTLLETSAPAPSWKRPVAVASLVVLVLGAAAGIGSMVGSSAADSAEPSVASAPAVPAAPTPPAEAGVAERQDDPQPAVEAKSTAPAPKPKSTAIPKRPPRPAQSKTPPAPVPRPTPKGGDDWDPFDSRK